MPCAPGPRHTDIITENSSGRLRGWGKKVKIQLFQNMVILHIKLNEIRKNVIHYIGNFQPFSLLLL